MQLIRAEMMCSPQPPDCSDENWVAAKEGECCPWCNATQSLSTCAPEALPLTETVGYVRQGVCVNQEPVAGLTECRGHCRSGTIHEPGNFQIHSKYFWTEIFIDFFASDSPDPVTQCECCAPAETTELAVVLMCSGQENIKTKIRVPTSCTCSPCGHDSAGQLQTVNDEPSDDWEKHKAMEMNL